MGDEQIVKILPIGDYSVGKSSLITGYLEMRKFRKRPLFPNFAMKTIIVDNNVLNLQIWETYGQERLDSLGAIYYRGCNGIMLVYDITNRQSFENLKEYWYKEVCQYSSMQTECILVGNKCDLESERAVDVSTGKEFADSLNIPFIETSVKENINVEKAFVLMAAAALKKLPSRETEKCDNIMLAGSRMKSDRYKCFC